MQHRFVILINFLSQFYFFFLREDNVTKQAGFKLGFQQKTNGILNLESFEEGLMKELCSNVDTS